MTYNKLILYGIYAFVFFVPLFPFKIKVWIFPVSADFLIIAYICAVLSIMLFFKCSRHKLLKSLKELCFEKLFIFAVLYSMVCITSFIAAVDKILVVTELMRYWSYIILFFVIITYVDTKQAVINTTKILLISISVAGIIGIIQYFAGWSTFICWTDGETSKRIYSTFVNPNYWGAAINVIIFPLLVLALNKVKYYKFIYLLSFILLLNLVLTFTRGSWLGFLAGLFAFIVLYNWKLVALLVVIISFGLLIPSVKRRFISTFDLNSGTVVSRFKLWKTGYLMFREHPLIGIGNGNSLVRYKEYIKKYPQLDTGMEKFSVHNSYLKVLSETGILGFVPYILVIYFFTLKYISIWKNGRDALSRNTALAFICSITSYLVQNLSNNLFFIPQVNALYWVVGALIIAYSNLDCPLIKQPDA